MTDEYFHAVALYDLFSKTLEHRDLGICLPQFSRIFIKHCPEKLSNDFGENAVAVWRAYLGGQATEGQARWRR
ncbi:hypothetical protein [uncultured Tateyamaria sp.]|uniref:hypothetical protein n=1 Tax=uncultured Tateyamaria sp. TaxID=455651 RepID=UPI00261A177C|nr:hypothetical protein [uncultured Tateyamaria sp.]